MKKYILAAALAAAPLMAATSAQAITVNPGSSLTITIAGNYTVVGGGPLGIGSELSLTSIEVSNIDQTNPGGINLNGLAVGNAVTVSGSFFLDDGGVNSGLSFGYPTNDPSSLDVGTTGGTSITQNPFGGGGSTQLFGNGQIVNGGSSDDASFQFATASLNSTGSFTLAATTPPEFTIPDPDPISPIPLPAAGWALFAALGSLVAFRRYSKA